MLMWLFIVEKVCEIEWVYIFEFQVSFRLAMGSNFVVHWSVRHIYKSMQLALSNFDLWWIHNPFGWSNLWNWSEHSNLSAKVVRRRKSIVRTSFFCFNFSPSVFVNNFFMYFKIRINASSEQNHEELINDSIAFLLVSIVETVIQLIAGVVCVDCFNQTAISQITRIRIKYFSSLMRQNIGWYDIEKGKSNFTVRLAEWVLISNKFRFFSIAKICISSAETSRKLKLESLSKWAIFWI